MTEAGQQMLTLGMLAGFPGVIGLIVLVMLGLTKWIRNRG